MYRDVLTTNGYWDLWLKNTVSIIKTKDMVESTKTL